MKKLLIVLTIILLVSCNDNSEQNKQETKEVTNTATKPVKNLFVLNKDSLYYFVEKQVSFGARVPGSKEHKACGDWLVRKFKSYGLNVIEQKTVVKSPTGEKYPVRNIIAEYNPAAKNRIIISAHWDTRPWADEDSTNKDKPVIGANDGASGVAVILELARTIPDSLNIGVDFILWDTEDVGKSEVENSFCLGSQYWAEHKHKPGYAAQYCINLDMVGTKNPTFPQEEFSRNFAPELVNEIWQIAAQRGYGGYFVFYMEGPIIDDHYYVATLGKIPAIDIISRDLDTGTFFPEWHTTKDNLSAISKETLYFVADVLGYYISKKSQVGV